MSDTQNDTVDNGGKGLVTITSEDMQALSTSGTNVIIPPDSPKKGHLFILNTTVATNGEMEIQRTLVEKGEKNDLDDSSEVTDPQAIEVNQDPKDHLEDEHGQLKITEEHKNEVQESQPQHETSESEPANEQINSDKEQKPDVKAHVDEEETDRQESSPQLNTNEHQEVTERHETEEVKSFPKEEGQSKLDEPEPVKEDASEPTEIADASVVESEEIREEAKEEDKKKKPKRTMTLPAPGSLKLPWQKKHVEDDSAISKPLKSSKEQTVSESATENANTSHKSSVITITPFSGVMKNIKKSLKIKVGGTNKSGDEAAPGRIQQKSGAKPSLRIVSSLNMSPAPQPEMSSEPDSPTTRRRKEIEEILSAMPPSPTPSLENIKDSADSSVHTHIYDNLPQGVNYKEENVITPSEEEIQPSVADKQVLTKVVQAIMEPKAVNMMESMHPEPLNGAVEGYVRPPRPPPAKNNSPSKPVPRNLPPPPRPPAPKVTLQKSYTISASYPNQSQDGLISPVTSPSALQLAPVQMRTSYEASTASLDRRKLYRSKAETKVARRATLSRPITMHETTFTLKRKPNEGLNKSIDENVLRSKSNAPKIAYEQRDSITLPKFLFGSKKKSVLPPVTRPQLAATTANQSDGASALRSIADLEDGNFISPVACNVQQSAPMGYSVQTTSVSVQTTPRRPKAPISCLRHGTSPIKSPPVSPPPGSEVSVPYIGKSIASEVQNSEEENSSLFAFQHIHKAWFQGQGKEDVEESASEKLVNRCLQEYMATCCRLRSVDLQGEFAAFHWQYGDLDDADWVKKGTVTGYNELEVYNDPSRHIDFVKLTPIQKNVGSLIYPEKTIDAMLSTWIDIGQTQAATTPSRTDSESEPVFHPAKAIIRLSDLLKEMVNSDEASSGMVPSLTLAILLSIDQCTANLPQSLDGDKKLFLNLNPSEILLLSSPANCLVIFRIVDSEGDWNIQRLLLELYPDNADSLEVAMKACFESLSEAARTKLRLYALLEAIAPPDWVIQTMTRIALGKGEIAPPLQDEN
nr:expressed conserved protein [Hymenolepis microstoma]